MIKRKSSRKFPDMKEPEIPDLFCKFADPNSQCMKHYLSEYEGQREFYSRIGIDPDLHHNTDGVDRGNLYENKLEISNIYEVLSQAIKYASRIRIRGELMPANIVLNDLNREVAYIFKSKDVLEDIEKVYFGASSKGNSDFISEATYKRIDYSSVEGLRSLLTYVASNKFIKYHVDSNNIVGLAQQFYKTLPDKDRFIKGSKAEIRCPHILSDRIIPYSKKNNMEFEDIMDCLNPGLLQREQGAYYTPPAYVAKMHELLLHAISEIPSGKDYIIIDRCAGTGNLEEGLPDEILRHCVLSTIEYNEYVILNYKYGDKCLVVIPNTDALAFDVIPAEHDDKQVVLNDFVREKINDNDCIVILMENPPYSEVAAGSVQNTGKKENEWKNSYIYSQMSQECSGVVLNDLANLFIWSGFKYYLTKPEDSFILFSPTKYWRTQNLANKQYRGGFFCDRRAFHTNQASAIGCIWWQNIEDVDTDMLSLPAYDIVGDSEVLQCTTVDIRKAYTNFTKAFDHRTFPDDIDGGIICERDGKEFDNNGRTNYLKPIYNDNIIAYLCVSNFQIDRKDVVLTRCGLYKAHGFYLRIDNFIEKLPLFVAATFPYDKWYKTDVYSKSYDGNGSYISDQEFLKKCLIYTALSPKNKCRSLMGSDGRYYSNELCFFDDDTIASKKLQEFIDNGILLDIKEKKLIKYWRDVLLEAESTDEYIAEIETHDKCKYGLWQISDEINLKKESGRFTKTGDPIMEYKYTALNSEISKLNTALKNYYNEEIMPLLFKYELIK